MLKLEQTTIPTKIKRAEQKRCEKRKAVATILKVLIKKINTTLFPYGLCYNLDLSNFNSNF